MINNNKNITRLWKSREILPIISCMDDITLLKVSIKYEKVVYNNKTFNASINLTVVKITDLYV